MSKSVSSFGPPELTAPSGFLGPQGSQKGRRGTINLRLPTGPKTLSGPCAERASQPPRMRPRIRCKFPYTGKIGSPTDTYTGAITPN